jgi:Fe-S cluster assembly iron-binding protein IscA
LALDEPTDNDEIHKADGITVAIDRGLLAEIGGVEVDYESNRWFGGGFSLRPKNGNLGGACC